VADSNHSGNNKKTSNVDFSLERKAKELGLPAKLLKLLENNDKVLDYLQKKEPATSARPSATTNSPNFADKAVRLLCDALGLADPKLARHCARVDCYSRELATILGLEGNERHQIFLAGMLHEIGHLKIAEKVYNIPDSRLTQAQKQLHQRYAIKGAKLVSQHLGIEPIAEIIKHHTERYDGTGYPDGLSQNDIPFGGAILKVADAYDKLLIGEPFGLQRQQPWDVARNIISKVGKHYHPKVVSVFFRWLEKNPVLLPKRTEGTDWYDMMYLELDQQLQGDLYSHDGVLLIKQGAQVTDAHLLKMRTAFGTTILQTDE